MGRTPLMQSMRARRATGRARSENRRAWEDWSRVDPLWSIVTFHDRRHGGWDIDEFFASGAATVDELWQEAARVGLPKGTGRALDFGCGVGRLTRGLGRHVDHVLGLDISQGMVDRARSFNGAYPNLEFAVHGGTDLHQFSDGHFDVVCCLLVLQHIPDVQVAESYLCELVRVLSPGGLLMLQLMHRVASPPPAATGLRARLRPRTRLAQTLRAVGVSPRLLSEHFHWQPAMPVVPISEHRASHLIRQSGGEIVWSLLRQEDGGAHRLYLVTR